MLFEMDNEKEIKVDGPGRRRSKEDENYWREGED